MASDVGAVDPGPAIVIDGAEMQKHSHTVPLVGDGKRAMIPDRRDETRILDTGKLALRAEGNDDFLIEARGILGPAFFDADDVEIKGEVPFPVEVQPGIPLELRFRMFGAGNRT